MLLIGEKIMRDTTASEINKVHGLIDELDDALNKGETAAKLADKEIERAKESLLRAYRK
jgi:hypothetical protein